MASIFTFEPDDVEYVGGGFNSKDFDLDAPEVDAKEGEELTEEPEQKAEKVEKAEPAEPAEDAQKATKQEPAPDAKTEPGKPADEPVAEPEQPKPDPHRQYDFLLEQNARMQRELTELKQGREETKPQIQRPTEEDFINDPAAASEQLIEWRDQQKAAEQQKTKQSELQQSHAHWERQVMQNVPAFSQNQELNSLWNQTFQFFADKPDGPMQAARMAAQIYEARHPSQQNQQQAPTDQPPQAAQAAREGDEASLPAEPDRAANLKKGAMHSSGKHTKPNVQGVDPKLAKIGKDWGISEESLRRVG